MLYGFLPRTAQLALIIVVTFSTKLMADSAIVIPTREEAIRVNEDTIGVVFTHEELFHQLVHNMESELEHDSQLRIVPIMGKNHVQSIYDLLYLKGVDLAMVRADAIEYVKREGNYPGIQRIVKNVAKVSEEKIVVISRKEYESLDDLDGQPVAVGLPGSGEYVTGTIAFGSLGIEPDKLAMDNTEAIQKMKSGELSAMVYLLRAADAVQTGSDLAAAAAVKNLQLGNELHLLGLPVSDELSAIYTSSELTHDDLPALIDAGNTISTYAVDAIIAAYQWSPSNPRYKQSERFVNALIDSLEGLQRDIYQPVWKRVNFSIETPNVQTLPIVRAALEERVARQAQLVEDARVAREKLAADAKARKLAELEQRRDELIERLGNELSETDIAESERVLSELKTFLEALE